MEEGATEDDISYLPFDNKAGDVGIIVNIQHDRHSQTQKFFPEPNAMVNAKAWVKTIVED